MPEVRCTYDWKWYEYIENLTAQDAPLLQGDYIKRCPVIIPPLEIPPIPEGQLRAKINVDVERYDLIVLSQSCDCANKNKIKFVLTAPAYPLLEYEQKSEKLKALLNGLDEEQKNVWREQLRLGNILGYHLINKCDYESCRIDDFIIVDFRNLITMEIKFLLNYSKHSPRLRLLPPYREQLAHAFANFISRVGLPQNSDIERFYEP
jgi:hypothetical protein